ncbi:quinone oxidoreductase family protein [Halopseudomonas sabulinigri]|uniref:Zinc-binding alcohol dehydrogenase family protein n=1 Tax=Halopseudomonas sabulinigri TaxID=472181 RepID=A0ABP9ZP41_9GAMM
MKAAVVNDTNLPPQYLEFAEPQAQPGEVMVTVRGAALSQLVRAQASGKHYSSPKPPFVPGADGVGVLDNGERVYFAFPRNPVGAMAERVAVSADCVVAIPEGIDDLTAAAIANPGMSSWAALIERASFEPGEAVLINGATGASGRLAIQIARHLGAGRIVVTGRNPATESELLALGADRFIPLQQDEQALAAQLRAEIDTGIDIVLDYLWGPSAAAIMRAADSHAPGQAARRVRFVNIGSLGGASMDLPAGALRSSGLELLGSGLGSVSNAALVRCVGQLLQAVSTAGLQVATVARSLAQVSSAWVDDSLHERIVFIP